MAHLRPPLTARRSGRAYDETRTTALEFAFLATIVCLIAFGAFHLAGANADEILETVRSIL